MIVADPPAKNDIAHLATTNIGPNKTTFAKNRASLLSLSAIATVQYCTVSAIGPYRLSRIIPRALSPLPQNLCKKERGERAFTLVNRSLLSSDIHHSISREAREHAHSRLSPLATCPTRDWEWDCPVPRQFQYRTLPYWRPPGSRRCGCWPT